MQIVHVDLNSAYLLTAERMQPHANGGEQPAGFLCDANGTTLPNDRRHETPKIYLDSIRGEYFMHIDHTEKERISRTGEQEIFQGAGAHAGWFVVAPDYTIHGRHGERAPKPNVTSIASSPSFETWTAPKNFAKPASKPGLQVAAPAAVRQVPKKTPAKKAAKKAAAKAAA